MKPLCILRKLFLWTLVLIVSLALTTCDLNKKDEETQPEEHCTSDNTVTKEYAMTYENYHGTYFCFKEGDYISLEYFSEYPSGICPDKLIQLNFKCELQMNQSKPIQVTAKVSWGPNDYNSEELPLDKTSDPVTQTYLFTSSGSLDLSNYFLDGGAANITLRMFFKFITSGDNAQDQEYFHAKFNYFTYTAVYYPY
jgi:hypothetical protein